MDLNYTMLRAVGNLSRAVNAINDVNYSDLKLHKNQYIFLTRICEHQGLSLRELSIMLKVDKTTSTKAVQKLIQCGYVYKKKSAVDSRRNELYPTGEALKIYEEIIVEENRVLDICFKDFSKEDIETAHQLIERMNTNLKDHWYDKKNYREEER